MKKIPIIVAILLACSSVSAKDHDKQIDSLGRIIRDLQADLKNLEDRFELEIGKIELATDKKLHAYNTNLTIINWVVGIGLAGLIGLFFRARQYVDKKVTTLVDRLVHNKEADIRTMIRAQELETRVRNSSRLLVLNPDSEKELQIEQIIKKFKFPTGNTSHKIIREITEVEGVDFQSYNVVIINDIDGAFNRDIVQALLDKSPKNTLFLGYATGTAQLPRHEKMNFANSQFTFYQNLINLLKFRHVTT